jgi:hypothetical protein
MVDIMKQNSILLLIIASVFFTLPVSVQAETVLRTGSDVSVEADQIVEGDYYVSAGPFGKTVMSGSVTEDMYALGASVTVNGDVGNDLSVLAGSSHVYASVTDDVRIVAGEVTLADAIGGDVFIIAGSLSVLSTARIEGDIYFFGGDVSIEGDVGGSVLGKAQSVDINSHIAGDVNMTAQTGLSLGNKAVIDGSVQYKSFMELTRGQGAIVGGEVMKGEYASVTQQEKTRALLIPIFITLFATLSLYLLFKNELEALIKTIDRSVARNALVGSAVVLLGPIAAILLMITVLGMLVGIMTLSVVVMLYVAGIALSSAVLGAYVTKLFTKKLEISLLTIIVGTVAMQLLLLIPVLGLLGMYTVFALTVGGITQQIYRHFS